jgi:hypothetical protein
MVWGLLMTAFLAAGEIPSIPVLSWGDGEMTLTDLVGVAYHAMGTAA